MPSWSNRLTRNGFGLGEGRITTPATLFRGGASPSYSLRTQHSAMRELRCAYERGRAHVAVAGISRRTHARIAVPGTLLGKTVSPRISIQNNQCPRRCFGRETSPPCNRKLQNRNRRCKIRQGGLALQCQPQRTREQNSSFASRQVGPFAEKKTRDAEERKTNKTWYKKNAWTSSRYLVLVRQKQTHELRWSSDGACWAVVVEQSAAISLG